jgi:hypothetical protein
MKHQLLKVFLHLLVLTACQNATVSAGTYESGFEAFQANQQKTALKIWSPLADQGNADAQFSMGVLYYSGGEIEQNLELAVEWFRKAANQEHAGAQFNLGNEYKRGEVLAQDDSKAVYWWRKAAQKGLLQAQHNLGMAYYFGSGIKQDSTKAMFWFKMAADSRYEPALNLVKQLQEEAKKTAENTKSTPIASSNNSPKKTSPTVTNTSPASREKWILAQPENNYTIQLFGSGNEEQVTDYINKHQLVGKVAYFNTIRDGETWYSVIYGNFDDVQKARVTVNTRDAIFKNSPWVRQFKSIQDKIKNTR